MLEQGAVAAFGEDREVLKFFRIFHEQEDLGFYAEEICTQLCWSEERLATVLRVLANQDLISQQGTLVHLTSRGRRVLREFVHRRLV